MYNAQFIKVSRGEGSSEKSENSPQIEKTIKDYSKKIDSLVKFEKLEMKKEIEVVNEHLSKNEIESAEATEQKAEISDKYAQRIETGVNNLQSELEDIIKEQVNVSLYDLDSSTNISVETKKRKYRPAKEMVWTATLGYSNLTDGWDLGSMNDSGLKFGKSVAFTTGPLLRYQPSVTSPFTLLTGLQFRSNNLRAENGTYFTDNDNDEGTLLATPYENQRKAKLRTNSLFIPVGFKYSFSKIEHDEENNMDYRNVDKGFYISTMLYGGLNLSNKSIVKYYSDNHNRNKIKNDITSVNDLMCGMEFDFGFHGYNFYIRKDFTDYFSKTTLPVNNGIEFGVRFGF